MTEIRDRAAALARQGWATYQARRQRQASIAASVKQTTIVYKDWRSAMEGIDRMASRGWRVASQTAYRRKLGGKWLLLGIFAPLFRGQDRHMVTYARD
jgi:hypothetical protein